MSSARLFLIDAHALCYRAFFAIKELRNSRGQATNAVYGFTAALKKILREYSPQYCAVCFDMKGKTRRQEKFSQYKIQRPAMPDELISQIPIIKDVARGYRLAVLEQEGYEADDLIATCVTRFKDKDVEVVIVSDDKDMFQLAGDKVKILSSRHDKLMGPGELKDSLGFDPALIPDYLALAGDSVDNIPGVKGVGDACAKDLLQTYGSLENIFKAVDTLKPPRVKKAIEAQQQIAVLSKELALLEHDAPVDVDLDDLKVGAPDAGTLREIFADMEFRKFAAELAPDNSADPSARVEVFTAPEQVKTLAAWIVEHKTCIFVCDPKTRPDEIAVDQRLYLSVDGRQVFGLDMARAGDLRALFENPDIVKITHDVKEQNKRCAATFPRMARVFDVMLAAYVLNPSRGQYDVSALAWDLLKKTVAPDLRPADQLAVLAALYEQLRGPLTERGLVKLFDELEVPLAFVLSDMEIEGVKLDEPLLERLSQQTGKTLDALVREIYRIAGEEFNINSPKQLSQILFEKLKLPVLKKTKTGFSTDEGVLQRLSQDHELPAQLLEYRQLSKLKSTYIDALPKLVDPLTGRVHTSFNQTGTETGRLSSSNPNLQNIPVRTELGRQIRGAFIPSHKDRVLVSADYSQIELRILAHLCGDAHLRDAFVRGEDIHTYTAAQVLEIDEKDVTPDMRNNAKRVNFGIIYGMSAFGLAKDLKISQKEAQDFIDRYFLRYPDVKKFMDASIALCRENGFVVTMLNRRRYIPQISSPDMAVRQFAERQAINTPVQGSAADMIKLAMVQIAQELRKGGFLSRMIITVHDELVFDVLPAEERRLLKMVRDKMENTMTLSVPVVVSIKRGKNWLQMEKIQ